MRSEILNALVGLAGKATRNTVADEVIKQVKDATHAEVAAALNVKLKDLFEHEPFPDGVDMLCLNKTDKSGKKVLTPAESVRN